MVETPKFYIIKGQFGFQAVMSGKVNRVYRATHQIIYMGEEVLREYLKNI